MTAAAIAIAAACVLAGLAGWVVNRRSGNLRVAAPVPDAQTVGIGLSRTGPTVVHFSAPWCGPCARVRRVISEVCDELGDVAHVEVDLDANPALARRLSVLSLPTTLIFDDEGRQRYRAAGVPSAADLRSVLTPLLA